MSRAGSGACSACLYGRSGGGVEPHPGPVGQPGYPLRPKDGRQRTQQVGQPPGWYDGAPLGPQQPPGDAGAMDGHDGGDLNVGDPEDLVGLVGLPQARAQGRDE